MESSPTENLTVDRTPTHDRIAAMVITRPERSCLLTINGGSSSLKFALFPQTAETPTGALLKERVERIGLADARAIVTPTDGGAVQTVGLDAPDLVAAAGRVILAHLGDGASLAAVHRGRPVD